MEIEKPVYLDPNGPFTSYMFNGLLQSPPLVKGSPFVESPLFLEKKKTISKLVTCTMWFALPDIVGDNSKTMPNYERVYKYGVNKETLKPIVSSEETLTPVQLNDTRGVCKMSKEEIEFFEKNLGRNVVRKPIIKVTSTQSTPTESTSTTTTTDQDKMDLDSEEKEVVEVATTTSTSTNTSKKSKRKYRKRKPKRK